MLLYKLMVKRKGKDLKTKIKKKHVNIKGNFLFQR